MAIVDRHGLPLAASKMIAPTNRIPWALSRDIIGG